MTCCSSEEIIPDDNKPYVPTIYAYPEYNLPRSNSELTKLALEDNNNKNNIMFSSAGCAQ